MVLLEVNHIKKSYRSRSGLTTSALRDVHFTVDAGEFVAIMGESGSGKTTQRGQRPAYPERIMQI